MKYITKNDFILCKSDDGDLEIDQDLGWLLSHNGLPKFKVVVITSNLGTEKKIVAVTKEEEKRSQEFFDQVMAARLVRYQKETDNLVNEIKVMELLKQEGIEEKIEKLVAAQTKIKTELPKPTVTWSFGL